MLENRIGTEHYAFDWDRRVGTIQAYARQNRINPDQFKGVYPAEEIRRDQEVVKGLNDHFEAPLENLGSEDRERIKRIKETSSAVETIVADGSESYDWMGENATAVVTSTYDDWVNGIDGVVEFSQNNRDEEPQRIALAIDASMNPDFGSVHKKVTRNIQKMTGDDKPPRVKYFESQITGKKGPLEMIVPVVVGVEGAHARELIVLFSDILFLRKKPNKTAKDSEQLKILNKKMETHPAQIIFLEEIKEQLQTYLELSGQLNNAKFLGYQKQIRALLNIIEEILTAKTNIKNEWEDDQVMTAISDILHDIKINPQLHLSSKVRPDNTPPKAAGRGKRKLVVIQRPA